MIAYLATASLHAQELSDIDQKDTIVTAEADSLNSPKNEKNHENSDSKFQVFMSIEVMGDQPNIIGNFLNLQRYSARQSMAAIHRNLRKNRAAAKAKRCWLISIFREPLDMAPFEAPWPVQCDVRLDNDFHTITPLIGF